MKLRYSKKIITLSIIFTSLWIFLGVVNLLDANNDTYILKKYGYGIVAILNISSLYLYYINGYGKLDNGVIIIGKNLKKKIKLSEAIEIQKFTDKIIFISPKIKIVLNSKQIYEEDWKTFITLPEIKNLITES